MHLLRQCTVTLWIHRYSGNVVTGWKHSYSVNAQLLCECTVTLAMHSYGGNAHLVCKCTVLLRQCSYSVNTQYPWMHSYSVVRIGERVLPHCAALAYWATEGPRHDFNNNYQDQIQASPDWLADNVNVERIDRERTKDRQWEVITY